MNCPLIKQTLRRMRVIVPQQCLTKALIAFVAVNSMAVASALELRDATTAFTLASCNFSQAPTIASGKYLFVQIQFSTADLNEDEREAKEFFAIRDALLQFVELEPSVACVDSPFCETLTVLMRPQKTISFSTLESCVVQDSTTPTMFSIVFAFDLEQVLTLKKKVKNEASTAKPWDDADWEQALKKIYKTFNTSKENREAFYFLLGCPMLRIVDGIETNSWQAPKAYHDSICNEASAEAEKVFANLKKPTSFFVEQKHLLWSQATASQTSQFYPLWRDNEEEPFIEAKQLYLKGKNLPRVIQLLCISIAQNPIHAEKWKFLGGALRAKKMPKDAIIAYLQSLRFNPNDKDAWRGLIDACENASLPRHAEGFKWFLKLQIKH